MHTPKDEQPFHNKAAVVHLTGPDYANPDVQQFEAVLPRPPVSQLLLGLAFLVMAQLHWHW